MFRAMIHSKYGREDVHAKPVRVKFILPEPVPEPEFVINSSPVILPVALESSCSLVQTSEVPPNGGCGWMVVFASFLISFVYWGVMKSLNVFSVAIASEFPDALPSVANWIFELTGTVSLITSPIAGIATKTYGFRNTALFGGVLCCLGLTLSAFVNSVGCLVGCIGFFVGVGASFAFTSSVACIGGHFTTGLPTALALSLSGASVGALVVPTGIGLVLQILGIRYCFFLLGGLFSVVSLCSLALAPSEDYFPSAGTEIPECEVLSETDQERRCNNKFALCSDLAKAFCDKLELRYLFEPTFLLTAISAFSMGMGHPHFLYYIPEQAVALGVSRESSLAQLSYAVIVSDLAYRVIYGCIVSRIAIRRSVEYAVAVAVSAAAVTVLPFCTEYYHLVLVSVFAGVGTGACTVLVPILLGENYGSLNLGTTFCLVRFFQGAENVVYVFAANILCETLEKKAVLFYMGSSMCLATALSIFLNLAVFVRNKRKKQVVHI